MSYLNSYALDRGNNCTKELLILAFESDFKTICKF